MKYNAKSMFDEIKNSYNPKSESLFKDVMKFAAGNTYLVRLVPTVTDPKQSTYHYFHHSWKSVSTGQFVSALCPKTYGESCPIDNYIFNIYNNGTEEQKKANRLISRKDNWMVNAYVINDPVTPENNGKVKVIRYGSELNKIIESALKGDDAEEFGAKIFDVLDGCTLRIKCESKTDKKNASAVSTTYVSSKFLAPSTLDGITEEKLDEIHNSVFDLTSFMKPKKAAELQRMLDVHFLCIKDADAKEEVEEDDEPTNASSSRPEKREVESNNPVTSETDEDTDAKLKALLADLD